jgi:hypothetical protein
VPASNENVNTPKFAGGWGAAGAGVATGGVVVVTGGVVAVGVGLVGEPPPPPHATDSVTTTTTKQARSVNMMVLIPIGMIRGFVSRVRL